MSTRRGWLPREGFSADVVQNALLKTILNPALVWPLLLLAKHTRKGQDLALGHPTALSGLSFCLYLGLARWANGFLNRGMLDNWQRAKYDWNKELVVITGGSDGIGKALVHLFAARGIKVVILDVQQPTFELPNATTHYIPVDLASPSSITTANATLLSTHGAPTILILNAGITNRHTILSTPDALLTRLFAVNTLSHYRLVRDLLPPMIAANHGTVVTVASVAGYVTAPGMVDYCSSKAAAVSFHDGLTAELRDRYNAPAVRTVCVCPNYTATTLFKGFHNDSRFLAPTLAPETVAEAVFAKVLAGTSGFVVLPQTGEWMIMTIRAAPYWWQGVISRRIKKAMSGVEKQEVERARALEKEREATKAVGKEEARLGADRAD